VRKWLNKPPAVAALVVLAIGIVYFNVLPPMDSAPQSSAVMPSEALFQPLSDLNVATTAEIAPVAMAIDWHEVETLTDSSSGRIDPFRSYTPAPIPIGAPVSYTKRSDAVVATPVPTLPDFPAIRAIIIGASLKYAMIGHEMVKEGDRVNGYEVVKITTELITLRGSAGSIDLLYHEKGGG